MKKTKKQNIERICKQDNHLLHQYNSGKISKAEYDKGKKKLHKEYVKLTGEKETIRGILKGCYR